MIDEIIKEVKSVYHPFQEFTWNTFYALCEYAKVDFFLDEMRDLRWAYADMLMHDNEIPKLLTECRAML